jgi:hypothetical protein
VATEPYVSSTSGVQQTVGTNRHCLTHSEAEEEAGLAHRGVADQEKLEQVIAIEGRQANKGGQKFWFTEERGGNKRWKEGGGGRTYNSLLIALPTFRFQEQRGGEERFREQCVKRGAKNGDAFARDRVRLREKKMLNLREVASLSRTHAPRETAGRWCINQPIR